MVVNLDFKHSALDHMKTGQNHPWFRQKSIVASRFTMVGRLFSMVELLGFALVRPKTPVSSLPALTIFSVMLSLSKHLCRSH
jgi:hypothetical protein